MRLVRSRILTCVCSMLRSCLGLSSSSKMTIPISFSSTKRRISSSFPLSDEGDGVSLVESLGEAAHGAYACCRGEELQFVQVLACLLFVLVLSDQSDEDGFLALSFSDDKLSHTLQKYDNIYRSCVRARGEGAGRGLPWDGKRVFLGRKVIVPPDGKVAFRGWNEWGVCG